MTEIIICLVIGLLAGGLIMRLSLRSKLKFTAIKNAEVIEYNHRLKEECDEIQKHLEKLCDEDKALKNEIEFLNKEKENAKTAIKDLKE
jgi:uncharacterized membrane-anchored protein YhcB (DUF1043 family)